MEDFTSQMSVLPKLIQKCNLIPKVSTDYFQKAKEDDSRVHMEKNLGKWKRSIKTNLELPDAKVNDKFS